MGSFDPELVFSSVVIRLDVNDRFLERRMMSRPSALQAPPPRREVLSGQRLLLDPVDPSRLPAAVPGRAAACARAERGGGPRL